MSLWTFIKKLSGTGAELKQQNKDPRTCSQSVARPTEAVHHSPQTIQNSDTIKVSGRLHHRILSIGDRRAEVFADIYDEDRTNYWVGCPRRERKVLVLTRRTQMVIPWSTFGGATKT